MNISTHALTEGDTFLVILILHFFHFNSRPHGGRLQERLVLVRQYYFNSRPHGGRPCFFSRIFFEISFQLTPSRRATGSFCCRYRDGGISTHALTEGDNQSNHNIPKTEISTHALTEGDRSLLHTNSLECHFNSRPHGGRPTMIVYPSDDLAFQLTPSRRATANLDKFFF